MWGFAQNNDGTFKKALGKKSLGKMFPGEMCHLSHLSLSTVLNDDPHTLLARFRFASQSRSAALGDSCLLRLPVIHEKWNAWTTEVSCWFWLWCWQLSRPFLSFFFIALQVVFLQ